MWIGVAGLDLVRDADGSWLVLEDNVRTPSGFAYLHATRRALLEHIDVPPDATPRPLDGEIDLLADTLRAVAPAAARGRRAPVAAVLTDGEHNSAYWEHAWLSRQLGIPLCEPHELEVRADGCLWLRPARLREARRIDVIYRRTNADRVDSDIARLLLPPVRAGQLGLVNQYGTGVADDKLTHAYVEDMIRFYVGEEPVLRSSRPTTSPSPASSKRRWTSSTSSSSSRAPATAASASSSPRAPRARRSKPPARPSSPTPAPGSPSAWSCSPPTPPSSKAAASPRGTSTCAPSSSSARAAPRASSRAA